MVTFVLKDEKDFLKFFVWKLLRLG